MNSFIYTPTLNEFPFAINIDRCFDYTEIFIPDAHESPLLVIVWNPDFPYNVHLDLNRTAYLTFDRRIKSDAQIHLELDKLINDFYSKVVKVDKPSYVYLPR